MALGVRKTGAMGRARSFPFMVALIVGGVANFGATVDAGAAPRPSNSPTVAAAAIAATTVVAAEPTTTVALAVRPNFKYPESELSFKAAGNTLYGTLERPAAGPLPGSRVPAVLLIADRSQTDRNGNGNGITTNTLQRLGDFFAANGLASLRFDKFGTGKTGGGTFTAHPETVTYDVFIAAANSAYQTLRAQSGIDPTRLGILGHGDGALIALSLATDTRATPGLKWLVVLNPPGVRALEVLEGQLIAALYSQATSTTAPKAKLDDAAIQLSTAVKQIRAGELAKVKPTDSYLAQTFAPGNLKFLQTQDAIDPQKLAANLRAGLAVYSACALRGGIFPCKTSAALRSILSKGAGRSTVELDDATHALLRVDPKSGQVSSATSAKLETGLIAAMKHAFGLK